MKAKRISLALIVATALLSCHIKGYRLVFQEDNGCDKTTKIIMCDSFQMVSPTHVIAWNDGARIELKSTKPIIPDNVY